MSEARPKRVYRKRRAQAKPNVIVVNAPVKKTVRRKANYNRNNAMTGYGKYKKPKNSRSIGQSIGSAIGGGIGLGAEHFVRWLTGMGDYEVKQNVLLSQDPPPMINESNKGGTLIRHREYIKDVYSGANGAFTIDSFLLNPANTKTFPWLSQIAANYEQYSFEGIIFEFRSMSSDALNSTNTALGSVIMATNYDTIDTNFQGKSEMENYEFGASCKPSECMMHPIECAPKLTALTELYTLQGALPAGADPRLYHWGNFQIATIGQQNSTPVNLGELWVTFQCRLIKPKMYDTLGKEVASYISSNNSYTNALPLGNGTYSIQKDTAGMFIDTANNNIGFPILSVRRHYLVNIIWQGSVLAYTSPSISLSNCSYTNTGLSTSTFSPPSGQSASRVNLTFTVMTAANALPIVSINADGTLPSAGAAVYIRISEINPFDY